jgi:hypothetical protein
VKVGSLRTALVQVSVALAALALACVEEDEPGRIGTRGVLDGV